MCLRVPFQFKTVKMKINALGEICNETILLMNIKNVDIKAALIVI